MSNIISLQDLNTTVNHEPRMSDLRIGEVLGFNRPRDIRKLIAANLNELNSYGEVCDAASQTAVTGGRPTKEYYLNEGQALVICALSRTPKAAEVRKAIIEVFMAYRNGNLPALPSTITDHQAALLKAALWKRKDAGKNHIGYYWNRFKNHFVITEYKSLPVDRFEEAMAYIPSMPESGIERDSPEHVAFLVKYAESILSEHAVQIQGELFQQDAHIKAYLAKLHESVCRAKGISYMARGVDMKSNMGKTLMNKLMGDLDQVLSDASVVTGHYIQKGRSELLIRQ